MTEGVIITAIICFTVVFIYILERLEIGGKK